MGLPKKLLSLLREWWDGIKEQVALVAFTQAVLTISKLTKPKVEAWALKINKQTDARFGEKSGIVQREVASNLRVLADGLEK